MLKHDSLSVKGGPTLACTDLLMNPDCTPKN